MADRVTTTNTLVSVGALLVLAAATGGSAIYIQSAMNNGRILQTGSMAILVVILAVVGLFFLGAAAYTLFFALSGKHKHKVQGSDDDWKNMPYPKD